MNTATWIILNAISNRALINGMTGTANQPSKYLISIEIHTPLITLPNKRKHNDIGSVNSLTMFIGSITGVGSINPFK